MSSFFNHLGDGCFFTKRQYGRHSAYSTYVHLLVMNTDSLPTQTQPKSVRSKGRPFLIIFIAMLMSDPSHKPRNPEMSLIRLFLVENTSGNWRFPGIFQSWSWKNPPKTEEVPAQKEFNKWHPKVPGSWWGSLINRLWWLSHRIGLFVPRICNFNYRLRPRNVWNEISGIKI
jgi:hypothetical protein